MTEAPPTLLRPFAAAACVPAAFAVSAILERTHGTVFILVPVIAVLVTGLVAGTAAALASVPVQAITHAFLLPWTAPPGTADHDHPQLLAYLVVGALAAVLSGQLHRSRRRLAAQRAATERALAQVRRLGALATGFSAASTPAQVSEVAFRACRALGASFANIAWVTADGRTLEAIFGFGHEVFTTGTYARYPVDAAIPNAEAFRTGAPVLLASPAELARAYPHLHDGALTIGARAWLAWPLVVRTRPVGVLGIGFDAPRAISADDSELLGAIAEHLAQALERARLLARAEESERRFRLLAENAPDVVYRYRLPPNPGYDYVSPSATAMGGYTPEEYYADPLLAEKLVLEEDRAKLAAVLADPGGGPHLVRWRRRDGKVIWTEQKNVVIRDREGTPIAIEGIARDVTQRVELQEQRERLAAEREDLLSAVSHDFRTPLQSVLLRAESLVRDPRDPAKTLRSARAIAESARRMRAAVQDVVHLARLGPGALPVHPEAVALAPFVHELTRRLYGDEDLARLQLALPPGAVVQADPMHLERILVNLLDNALRFSDAPAPVRVAAGREGERWVVAVSDRGPGIAPEDLPRLFERYFRGSRPTGREGTGLGLYACRLLVEAQGGRVTAESAPGEGATFRVHLPAAAHT